MLSGIILSSFLLFSSNCIHVLVCESFKTPLLPTRSFRLCRDDRCHRGFRQHKHGNTFLQRREFAVSAIEQSPDNRSELPRLRQYESAADYLPPLRSTEHIDRNDDSESGVGIDEPIDPIELFWGNSTTLGLGATDGNNTASYPTNFTVNNAKNELDKNTIGTIDTTNQTQTIPSFIIKPFVSIFNSRSRSALLYITFLSRLRTKMRKFLPVKSSEAESGVKGDGGIFNGKSKQKRWNIPLTSKPFQGFENLQSTIYYCTLAISLYFFLGILAFLFWLEPKWTIIDALYFSMTTLTTVGYGDLVVSGGSNLRGILGKAFVSFFNVYAVCISVSALGVIAKLALNQERKLVAKAKEKARSQLIQMFNADENEKDEEDDLDDEEVGDNEDEEFRWIDHIYDDQCDPAEKPMSVLGVLFGGIKRQSINFVLLSFVAAFMKRAEGWSLIDVLYYWNCTATTIGFGDLSPKTQLGRLLAVFFIPLSVVTLGEVIANCFAYVTSRAAAKAEKDFIRREITLSDLEYLDVNGDGRVDELEFVTFMLLAMQKVDMRMMNDLKHLFHALDAGKDGFIQKEDLITLRQRKRLARKMRRRARHWKKWYENEARSFFS
mmetsp:Transcript_18155/g.37909  ORF Transcript_18155/g.37909 Transcript_18155/m.37909 type:complete len:606 (+) Transcript_18155:136-1953(+)